MGGGQQLNLGNDLPDRTEEAAAGAEGYEVLHRDEARRVLGLGEGGLPHQSPGKLSPDTFGRSRASGEGGGLATLVDQDP